MPKAYPLLALLLAGGIVTTLAVTAWRGPAAPLAQDQAAALAVPLMTWTATPVPTPKPFRIMLVPGHDTDTGGARYLDVYEREVAADLAQAITEKLKDQPGIQVLIARNRTEWYQPLATYFATQEPAILDFKNRHQAAEKAFLASGQKKVVPDMANHTSVDKKTALELYGLNKWANENEVDLLVHLHFNDDGRANRAVPGTYHGFTIYVPEKQLPNAAAARPAAEAIFKQLKTFLTPELNLTEDQSLIALGASATLDKPSLLIEYAYIYEKPLRQADTRAEFIQKLAELTAAGLRDYLAALVVQ